MKLTNMQIYINAQQLVEAFQDTTQRLPAKINFYIQKNKKTLLELAQDIETARQDIINTYGKLNIETQQYNFDADKIELANKEMEELLNIEQEVNIVTFNIDSLSDDLVLTTGQMEAIMFMID